MWRGLQLELRSLTGSVPKHRSGERLSSVPFSLCPGVQPAPTQRLPNDQTVVRPTEHLQAPGTLLGAGMRSIAAALPSWASPLISQQVGTGLCTAW